MADRPHDDDETPPPFAAWLPALLEGRTEAEREDFLAALLLNAGFDVASLSTPLQALLERFAIRADIHPGPEGAVERQLAEYFALNPLPPDLVQSFERRFRADLLADDPDRLRGALDQLGQEMSTWAEREAPAPPGSHKGGALGFFAARASFDKSGK